MASCLTSASPALAALGPVWAWGGNNTGELGNGSTNPSPTPVQVVGPGGTGTLTGVVQVSAGGSGHSLAVRSDRSVWAWGDNAMGELGNNASGGFSSSPVQVVGAGGTGTLSGVVAVAGGGEHSLAVKSDGTVWAWGLNNFGQLGDNNAPNNKSAPVQVLGPGGTGTLSGVVAVAAGCLHSLALRSDGTVWAWGNGGRGQLGDNNGINDSSTPVQVVGPGGTGALTGVVAIAAGCVHSLAVTSDGSVWAWGDNAKGELGNNVSGGFSSTPVQVVGPGGSGTLSGVTGVAAGHQHSVAVKSDGTVWTWGLNNFGQLGDNNAPNNSSSPVQVLGPGGIGTLSGVTSVAAGYGHSMALKPDGSIWTWGHNANGELGNGTKTRSPVPVQVVGPGGTGTLSAAALGTGSSAEHSLAVGQTPTPAVSAVSPSSGATAGGTGVTISGSGFTGASAVRFGAAAASFAVISDTQIVAFSPSGSGTVDVTVTTPGGTSATNPADQFSYIATLTFISAPSVFTGQTTVTGSRAAGFSGAVNPDGLQTSAYFQYGLDPSYNGGGPLVYTNQVTASPSPVGSDFSVHQVSGSTSGLVPNALYHVRLVATNSLGTTYGSDQTFRTSKDPPPSAPALGKSFNLSPVSGHVYIKVSSSTSGGTLSSTGPGFVPLTQGRKLPAGTQIDSRYGSFKLTSASGKKGKLFSGTFSGAVVAVSQIGKGPDRGLTTFRLLLGQFPGAPNLKGCSAKKASRSPASGGPVAQIASLSSAYHSRSHGRYRTRYRQAAASSPGTQWDTIVRCDGVLFKVFRGTVVVNDSARHKTVTLHAGQRYLAKR